MKKSLPILVPILVFALGLVPHRGAFAADAKSPAESSATFTQTPPAELVTIDFPGGSLAQLAAAVASSGRGTFNIIGEAADANQPVLPKFSVRNADPGSLMEAVNALLRPHDLELNRPYRSGQAIEGTYTVYRRSPAAKEGRPYFESFQLAPYLAEQTTDDIVGAIRAAWELDPSRAATALRLKFHPATEILLVSGPEDAIRIAKNVLAQLKRPSPLEIAAQQRQTLRAAAEAAAETKAAPPPSQKK